MTEATENYVSGENTLQPSFDLASFGDKTHADSLGDELDITQALSEAEASKTMMEEAQKIWEEGRALDFMLSSCKSIHKGDLFVMECLILSYVATRIKNCGGIHISISGSAGSGKSHVAFVVKNHLPDGVSTSARLSDKALFRHKKPPKSVIIMDDQDLSNDMQEAIKNSTTNWDIPYQYETINKNAAETLTLPTRAVYWIIITNTTGDEQIADRMLALHIDESSEQKKNIQEHIKNTYLPPSQNAEPQGYKEDRNMKISKLLWQNIPDDVEVYIPYSKDIDIEGNVDSRNVNLFFSLIQAITLLHATKRRTENGGILASVDDFKEAERIMNPLLTNKGGSQTLKISAKANTLLKYLLKKPSDTYSFGDLQRELKCDGKLITEATRGRKNPKTNEYQGGLVNSCPGLEVINLNERYETLNEEYRTKTRSRKAIVWDKETAESSGLLSGGISMRNEKRNYWLQQERRGTNPL